MTVRAQDQSARALEGRAGESKRETGEARRRVTNLQEGSLGL